MLIHDIAIGTDIVEVKRIENLIIRFGDRFLRKIFCDNEIIYCRKKNNPYCSFAARFAAKEAFSKALGCGIGQYLGWRDIAIEVEYSGKPMLILSAGAQLAICKAGFSRPRISLSHTKTLAQATVVLIK